MPDDLAVQEFAYRFTVTFDGPALSFPNVSMVEMRAGSSDPIDDLSESTGFWFDLRDEQGEVIFRRITSSPMSRWVEVPDDTGGFSVMRGGSSSGEFELIAPVMPEARTLAIFGPDPALEEDGSFAVQLGELELGGVA